MIGYARDSHLRLPYKLSRNTALAWALAAAVGMTAAVGTAQAARLGHAHVDSAPGAPLQVVVPLLDLTPDEAANLQVSLADAAAWQQAGLQPPTPLADTYATLETGANGSRVVRVSSTQAATTDAIDVLLELHSNAGQRQLQVTVLVPPSDASAGIQRASAGNAAPGAGTSDKTSAGQVKVRRGQTLWGIAASHAVPNTTIYQELVALWQANPQAFSQNNMDLVRAGSTLTLPDAATVQAINPDDARRIFAEQVDAYHRYLAGRGARGAPSVAQGRGGASGKVGSGPAGQGGSAASAQDQLRLSSATSAGADAKADESTSAQHAMEDASKRVDELKSNVEVLNQAASAAGAAMAAAAGEGTNGQPGADASQAASGKPGTSGAPGAPGTSGNGTTEGVPATGPNSPAAVALDAAKQVVAKTGMPNWLSDNLLTIITVVLAVVIFIVAWVLRRAGQRRTEDDEIDGFAEPPIDGRVIDEKLSHINLELDKPRAGESPDGGRA